MEIIIDNINVYDCDNYRELSHVLQGNHTIEHIKDACLIDCIITPCSGKNCLFKQLKNKEKECENYYEALKNIREIISKEKIDTEKIFDICNSFLEDCTTCENSYIKDGIYLICDINGLMNDTIFNCKDYKRKS